MSTVTLLFKEMYMCTHTQCMKCLKWGQSGTILSLVYGRIWEILKEVKTELIRYCFHTGSVLVNVLFVHHANVSPPGPKHLHI